jgi:alpha-tubulin suppressor-like RCC1 family protein
VSQIACGSSHTLFLSDSGRVYSVGHGDSGQLGLGPNVKSKSVATCLPLEYDEFTFVFITVGIAHNG